MAIFKAAIQCKKFGKLFVYRSWQNFMEKKGKLNPTILKEVEKIDCAAKSKKCFLFAPVSYYEGHPEKCADILQAKICDSCVSAVDKILDKYTR